MAQEKSDTPESQLLRLIEKPQSQEIAHQVIKRKRGSILSLEAARGRFLYFKQHLKTGLSVKKFVLTLGPKAINTGLKFVILILFLYLGTGFVFSMLNLDSALEIKLDKGSNISTEKANAPSLLKKLSYYLGKPASRDIFKFWERPVPQEEAPPEQIEAPKEEKPTSKIKEMVADLRLVGVSWSDDPDAMIENTKTKTTYFLKRGQLIEGEIKIKAIFVNKLTLSYDGEETELK